MIILNQLNEIKKILEESTTIAVVGLSPKESRPSNMVARYLLSAGYTIIPVNPGHDMILGLKCYPDLLSIPEKVNIVDIFRRAEDVSPIVQQAIEIQVKTIWMQQGIINHAAAELARKDGLNVIMDRCIKIDHANLLAKN